MPQRSGLDAQLGLAEETTYGTYIAPARFLEFNTESMKLDIARNASQGRRTGQYIERQDHWKAGKRQAKGSIEFDIGNKSFGLLLTKHLLGAVTTTADGAGKKHSGAIGDLFGKSLTIQIGRPDVSATVQPFSYLGAKILGWEIASSVDGFATLKLDLDSRDETTAQALASATAPTATEILHWSGAVITVAGAAMDASSVSFKGTNASKDDRFLQSGATLKKEPISNKFRDYTGVIVPEFENLTAYNRFINGTAAIIVATWTATSTYDTAKPFKLVVTVNSARFDGETPTTDGENVLMQNLPFRVLDDGATAPILVDYYTSDALP